MRKPEVRHDYLQILQFRSGSTWWRNGPAHLLSGRRNGLEVALAYDSAYGLMSDAERRSPRRDVPEHDALPEGLRRGQPGHERHSNWVAHITGGSLTAQAAIFADGPEGRRSTFSRARFSSFMTSSKSTAQAAFGQRGYCY
jgi:hypothetical protein